MRLLKAKNEWRGRRAGLVRKQRKLGLRPMGSRRLGQNGRSFRREARQWRRRHGSFARLLQHQVRRLLRALC